MTNTKRDWVRIIGITGATLVLAGGLTLGGLKAAEATGYVTLPERGMHKMGHQQDGGFGMDQRGGRRNGGNHGNMGGFGDAQGQGNGRGMMDGSGFGRAQAAGDEQIIQHLLTMLQDEQVSAAALGTTESAAKAIATTRSADIVAVQALLQQWYPDAQAQNAPQTGSATTIDALRQEMLHHSQMLEKINASATFEHPELATWIAKSLVQRATEITTLYSK
jgi:hypothetical protein